MLAADGRLAFLVAIGTVIAALAAIGVLSVSPMMYVALSYDHRIIDGREAVTFLKRIKECVEDPQRMLLEI